MDTLAFRLAVPFAGPALDFSQQVSAPYRAHKRKRATHKGRPTNALTRLDIGTFHA
jgi:hypothetical protein